MFVSLLRVDVLDSRFCSMFVDHPQSLLASLESLQSSEVIEEHSAQLDWIIKVTCSLGPSVKTRLFLLLGHRAI